MAESTWQNGIDGLSAGLAKVIGEKSASDWKKTITQARSRGDRYFLIKRRVDYKTLQRIRELTSSV